MSISGHALQFENPSTFGEKLFNHTQNLLNFNGKKAWVFLKNEKGAHTVYKTQEKSNLSTTILKIALIVTVVAPIFSLLYRLCYFGLSDGFKVIQVKNKKHIIKANQWHNEIEVPKEALKKISRLMNKNIRIENNVVYVKGLLGSGEISLESRSLITTDVGIIRHSNYECSITLNDYPKFKFRVFENSEKLNSVFRAAVKDLNTPTKIISIEIGKSKKRILVCKTG